MIDLGMDASTIDVKITSDRPAKSPSQHSSVNYYCTVCSSTIPLTADDYDPITGKIEIPSVS